MSQHATLVRNAELLAVTSGTVGGKPQVFLTLRLDPDASFDSSTLSLSPEQARRLLNDLNERLENSSLLAKTEHPINARGIYEQIMNDEPVTRCSHTKERE